MAKRCGRHATEDQSGANPETSNVKLSPDRESNICLKRQKPRHSAVSERVDDRIRTGDRLDHNQELYQLSYVHRAAFNLACRGGC